MESRRGAKFPIERGEGLALEEFIDSAGVNHPSTAPTRGALHEVPTPAEIPAIAPTHREIPYLLIAGVAAIVAGLFILVRSR